MEKEFIPYEQALELKELEFNEPCLLHIQYSSGTDVSTGRKFKNSIWLGNGYDAEIDDKKIKYKFPKHSEQGYGTLGIATFSQAFRFFRENYRYDVAIKKRRFEIEKLEIYGESDPDYYFTDFPFDSYEESELKCLKKLIEIVKRKNK